MSLTFGISQIFDGRPGRSREMVHSVAQHAEVIGFAELWVPDHVAFFPDNDDRYPHSDDGSFGFLPEQGILEPLMVLQEAASATTHLRLGTSVDIGPARHPLLRARQLATLDQFSAGRVDYGMGIGWMRGEYRALGLDWSARGQMADEHIAALRALWTTTTTTYHGRHVSFSDVIMFPKPVQPSGPPILIGGNSPAAIARAVRLGDGWLGWNLGFDELADRVRRLRAALHEHKRDPATFRLCAGIPLTGQLDVVGSYSQRARRLGLNHLSFGWNLSRRNNREQLETLAFAAGI